MLHVDCLGTVRAHAAGHPLALGGRQQRAVLAMLVAARGRTVSADSLVEEVWSGDPPPSASSALQAYVSRLRSVLETGRAPREPARVLVSVPPGYALRLPDEAVDTWHVTSLVAAAGDAPDEEAVRLVDAALEQWRGEPFAEFAGERWARDEVARLEAMRTAAVELRAAAALRLGRVAEALPALEEHTRAHPLREEAVALHARALYAAGRQAEALGSIAHLRARLDDELGVRPGPAIAALETDILRHADRLQPPARPVREPSAEPAPPPPPSPTLVGRDAESARIAAAAVTTRAAGLPRVVWVEGEPGIGKSTLVAAAAAGLGGAPTTGEPWTVHRLSCPEVSGAPAGALWRDLVPAATVGSLDLDGTAMRAFAVGDAVLRTLGDGPSVLVLEDLHRADDLSLQVLRHIVQAGRRPVLVLATYRTLERGQPLAGAVAATTERTVERIHLAGLLDGPARSVLAGHVEVALPERVWRRLLDRAAGNPLFLRQLGRLVSSEGAEAGERLPVGVRDLIRRRVDRLAPETVEVLAHAAVLGRAVEVDVLVALEDDWAGLTEVAVLDHLDVGLVHGLLDVGDPGRLEFSHVLVRDTLEDVLAPMRRQRVHRAALAVLDRLHPEAVEERARHASAGLDRRSAGAAVPVLLAAAERADDVSAVGHLRDALRALDLTGAPRADRLPVRLALVRALARSGDSLAARAERVLAVAEARAAGDLGDLARAWSWPAPLLWSRRSAETSAEAALVELDAVRTALERRPEDASRQALLVEVRASEAVEADPGDTQRVVAAGAAAVEVAERLGDPELLCRALNAAYLGTFAHGTGYLRSLAERLVGTAASAGLVDYEAAGHLMLHSEALGRGDLAGARTHAREATMLSTRGRLAEMQLVDAVLGATAALVDGDPDTARRTFVDVCARITASGDANGEQIELWARFSVEFVVGDTAGLLPAVSAMEPRLPVELNDVLVCCLLDAGETDRARTLWRPEDWQRDATWLFRSAVRAWVAATLGDAEVGARLWRELRPWSGQVVRTLNGALVLGPVDHYLDLLAPLLGQPPTGRAGTGLLTPNRHLPPS